MVWVYLSFTERITTHANLFSHNTTIHTNKLSQDTTTYPKNIDCRPAPLPPYVLCWNSSDWTNSMPFFQTFLLVDTPWTTQLNYMKYKQCTNELNAIYLELLNW